jgi:hypothetical protein
MFFDVSILYYSPKFYIIDECFKRKNQTVFLSKIELRGSVLFVGNMFIVTFLSAYGCEPTLRLAYFFQNY